MTTFTEGRHTAEFIISEANHNRSRENGTVLKGQNLESGEIVQKDSAGKLIAADGILNSDDVELDTAVVGIVIDNVDASSTGTDADTDVAYIARDAEVNDNLLTYPDESSPGNEKIATAASLVTLGIIVR